MKTETATWEQGEAIRQSLKRVSALRYNLSKCSEWGRMITDHEKELAAIGLRATRQQIHRALTSDRFRDVWDMAEYLNQVAKPL